MINFIQLIMIYKDKKIVKEYIKNFYYDKAKVLSNLDIQIKSLSNCSNYLFNNINQPFSNELISQSYFLLTNELLDKVVVDKLLELYYKNIDCAPHSLAALLHLFIVNEVNNCNVEFAFLISNYIMLKKNRWFLIPYEYCFDDYKQAINSNNLSDLIRLFYDIEIIKKEKKPCLYTRDEVVNRIKSLKEELIKNYNVNKLYLFGSFAKGINTDKSDLDLVVILNESLLNIEKNKQIKLLNEYLSKVFDCDVDLLDFSYALNTFDKSQLEYLITLI